MKERKFRGQVVASAGQAPWGPPQREVCPSAPSSVRRRGQGLRARSVPVPTMLSLELKLTFVFLGVGVRLGNISHSLLNRRLLSKYYSLGNSEAIVP